MNHELHSLSACAGVSARARACSVYQPSTINYELHSLSACACLSTINHLPQLLLLFPSRVLLQDTG